MDPTDAGGDPHGKSYPFRWDVSTAAATLVLGALAYLVIVNKAFRVSGNAAASVGR